jgi:phospholipid/cholesterol/gamma-HCH transport system ATP-binding protein
MAPFQSSVLSLRGVSLVARRARVARTFDFDLNRREVALVEYNDDSNAEYFVDVCLGLSEPAQGDVYCLGEAWAGQGYHSMLGRRSRIGTLIGSHVWPAHMPVAQAVLTPRLYHTRETEDATLGEATVLARRFGLPGLPTGSPETVRRPDLTRAACVGAFLGMPELVVLVDRAMEAMPELGMAMAQAVGAVQDRGGAVLWLLSSLGAPAARFVAGDHVLRLHDRGLEPARRPT